MIKNVNKPSANSTEIYILQQAKNIANCGLSKKESAYVKGQLKSEKTVYLNDAGKHKVVALHDGKSPEKARELGNKIGAHLNGNKLAKAHITGDDAVSIMAVAEGMALGNYQFLKYFADAKKRTNTLKTIEVCHSKLAKKNADELNAIVAGVYESRDLVNEPLSYLTAVQLSKEIERMGKDAGFKVEVLNQAKIESLKMGGLLAVNKGSVDPATFSILEWKPKNATNKKPLVLVGKGVVYDTGGLSLKPTPNSMDIMKCDMAGAAAVIGGIYTIAKNKLPVHVVALVPATDNRPGGNAYAPGDVVTMYDGTTVEVLNTDAEGRMLLADALAYAKKYKPELVIDAATLTGAAARAIGPEAIVAMGNAPAAKMKALKDAGEKTYERLAEFPFYEEYAEYLKSSIADMKNIGGPSAGAITAGKFLEHFTDYPYIHLDVAGPAWLDKNSHYRTKGGSGIGVRLFYEFAKSMAK